MAQARSRAHTLPGGYKHLVVIYEENHSFDNLYGGWGRVNGQRVNGLARPPAAAKTQVAQDGTAYGCLLQNDVNLDLADAARGPTSTRHDPAHDVPDSHFPNHPFLIDNYIEAGGQDLPGARGVRAQRRAQGLARRPPGWLHPRPGAPLLPGAVPARRRQAGPLRDGLRRGRADDGPYRTKQLPIYRYLHSKGAPHYVVADRFFQAAFGGSFLNHQFLVAARAPLDTAPPAGGPTNSVLDANGFPNASTRCTSRPAGRGRRAADPEVRRHANLGPGEGVRRLRGQHHPAGEPADRAQPREAPA